MRDATRERGVAQRRGDPRLNAGVYAWHGTAPVG
jgi:hypothetical protein